MLREVLLLFEVAACAANGGASLLAPPMRHAHAKWGFTLPRPLPRGGPSSSCTLGDSATKARGALALRGGSDNGQLVGANEMALAHVTDCKVLVAALMSSDNDERAAAEKRYDTLKVCVRVREPALICMRM